jgi:hypothetical protein
VICQDQTTALQGYARRLGCEYVAIEETFIAELNRVYPLKLSAVSQPKEISGRGKLLKNRLNYRLKLMSKIQFNEFQEALLKGVPKH